MVAGRHHRHGVQMARVNLDVGAATRPYPGETENGDAWTAGWIGGLFRVAVIDGLGHGPAAADASARAVAALETRQDADLAEALRACHDALIGTRGAAMSVALLDPERGVLIYAGIGNIEAHLWRADGRERPISYRGIVGWHMRTVRTAEHRLDDTWTLIVHSDGIGARFEPTDPDLATHATATDLAEAILARNARATDDATVVVVRPLPTPPL